MYNDIMDDHGSNTLTELFLECQHHDLPVLQLAVQSDHQIIEPYLSVVWTPVMM